MAQTRIFICVVLVVAGVAGVALPNAAPAASCEAILGKWAWFIGGEVIVNRDGTFTQQSGNDGTWECTDGARGKFTFRWRVGGFVNSLAVSPDGQGLTSLDQSQLYVTARRSAPAPPPQPARQEDCCQEAYGCETQRIEAAFAQKMAQCHHPGNAACIKEAVSTKAAQLQAASEKLQRCNRAASGAVSGPGQGAVGTAALPGSSDEFHSTDRPGFFSQACQACQIITSGQTTTPPEPEPPTLPPFKTGTEENVTIPDKPLSERWEDWAKDYNDKVKIWLRDFGSLMPDDGNDYTYSAIVRVFPDGRIEVFGPAGGFYSSPTNKNAAKVIWDEHRPQFIEKLQRDLHPLPFPDGSRWPSYDFTVTYKRSKADTPFTPAPTPQEPPPPRPARKKSR